MGQIAFIGEKQPVLIDTQTRTHTHKSGHGAAAYLEWLTSLAESHTGTPHPLTGSND